jgi:hypothetical protein
MANRDGHRVLMPELPGPLAPSLNGDCSDQLPECGGFPVPTATRKSLRFNLEDRAGFPEITGRVEYGSLKSGASTELIDEDSIRRFELAIPPQQLAEPTGIRVLPLFFDSRPNTGRVLPPGLLLSARANRLCTWYKPPSTNTLRLRGT